MYGGKPYLTIPIFTTLSLSRKLEAGSPKRKRSLKYTHVFGLLVHWFNSSLVPVVGLKHEVTIIGSWVINYQYGNGAPIF
jgi:hypothetical protein